jgi:hypothetical protein
MVEIKASEKRMRKLAEKSLIRELLLSHRSRLGIPYEVVEAPKDEQEGPKS